MGGGAARVGLLAAALVAGGVSPSCTSSSTFACDDHDDCVSAGPDGTCEPSGGCSFPDDGCDSGRRYGEYAPAGLGGTCVPVESETTSEGTQGSGDGPGSSGGGPGSGTLAVDATGPGESSTTGSAADSTGDASASSDGTTGDAPAMFFDDFDRPDAPELGNGWIEKTPDAFRLLDGQAELDTVNGLNFRNNLFYRPLSESLLDVEAFVAVDFVTDDPFGFPQMHVRVQADDVAVMGSLTSYAVFVDSNDPMQPVLTCNRIAQTGFGPSTSTPIVPPPVDAESYRLRGRITGVDPVVVEGFFEVWDGSRWQVRTENTLVDDTADRITTPGTMGAGGHEQLQYFVLDDYGYAEITP